MTPPTPAPASADHDSCGCLPFCEICGRDYIGRDDEGFEICTECSADGYGGELCHAIAESCDMLNPKANEWVRTFMCATHAAENVAFCAECYAAEDDQ